MIVRVSPSGNDTSDGSTWALAKKTVQSAIDAAANAGGEVWVSKGIYLEKVVLKPYVYVYGGFAGSESSRLDRNWSANRTVLDASGSGATVTASRGYLISSIDGFTIRGGRVYCGAGGSLISNNLITQNRSSCGGGIECYYSSPLITNNTITGNVALDSGFGGGVYLFYSSALLTGNTIAGNRAYQGGGIYCIGTSNNGQLPKLMNNVIAYNSSGIYAHSSIEYPITRYNCIYNPDGDSITGGSLGVRDIAVDPKFLAIEYGDTHLLAGSPCIDAGDDSAVLSGAKDIDAETRILGRHVDMGADEFNGTSPIFTPSIVRVSPTGSDSNDGSSWTSAKKTVQAGIDSASAPGGEVWVAGGTYVEQVTLKPYTYLYGGFGGTENTRNERDWVHNKTVIDGAGNGTAVKIATGCGTNAVDGFVLRNGNTGIWCDNVSPKILHNSITSNRRGVYCNHSSPTISSNILLNNSDSGIDMDYSSPPITNNTIVGSSNAVYGGGIGNTLVSNNIIAFNSTGLYFGPYTLRNNCVYNPGGKDYDTRDPHPSDICADPLFIDRTNGDLHLTLLSPCIDAGWNGAAGLSSTDVDGEPRIMTGAIDIGADEVDYAPSIADTKQSANGKQILITSATVTASFPDFFYIESDDRSVGIRVEKTAHGVAKGQRADIVGIASVNAGGERCIAATSASGRGSGHVAPLGMSNRNIGGGKLGYQDAVWGWQTLLDAQSKPARVWQQLAGLSNIGLLIRTYGKATRTSDSTFTIDDGSEDNIECVLPTGVTFDQSWSNVIVTGICSCRRDGTQLLPRILIRTISDVRPL